MDTIYHVYLSIAMHLLGFTCGIWIWHLFPKEPRRTITAKAIERQILYVKANSRKSNNMLQLNEDDVHSAFLPVTIRETQHLHHPMEERRAG